MFTNEDINLLNNTNNWDEHLFGFVCSRLSFKFVKGTSHRVVITSDNREFSDKTDNNYLELACIHQLKLLLFNKN